MIYPSFPGKGSVIGICAPSAGTGHKTESFDMSLDTLRGRGYKVIETASVRTDDIRSAPADVRGAEFNSLVKSSDVDMIIAATGGDYNIEMLPYIDEQAVIENQKWIAGASDPTNILYYVTTKLDIATIYGFNAGSFDWRPLHGFQENALAVMNGDMVTQDSFDKYNGRRSFEITANDLDTPVVWELYDPAGYAPGSAASPLSSLDVRGRLIGGCLDCISALIGTPYDGTESFIEKYQNDGIIWYFDIFDMSPERVLMTLDQMKYCGYFEHTSAILFGRVMFMNGRTDAEYVEHISAAIGTTPTGIKFVWNADIGHVKPCMTLINGAIAGVSCANGKASISMSLD